MKIRGIGTYRDANGKSHNIIGIGELPDGESLQELEVSGNLSFKKLSCDEINVSGKCNGGSITADYLKSSGELSVDDIACNEITFSGKCAGDSVDAKTFSGSGKVEVDTLTIEQTMQLSGRPQINSVSADEIVIESRDGSIGKIKCRKIKIFDNSATSDAEMFGKIFGEHFSLNSRSRVRVKSIEADTVALENCEVDVIKCKDAFIGTNCAIEKLSVSGECTVAAGSTVGETIRS